MKYMILIYGTQGDYDAMVGKPGVGPAWTPEDFGRVVTFMESLNKDLADSGELVETRALTAPQQAKRLQLRGGVAAITDGPYAETQEVLASYWIVECSTVDRAVEIAKRLLETPGPEHLRETAIIDVRPIADTRAELEG